MLWKIVDKMAKLGAIFSRKLPISLMLFKSRDEKRIFGLMNFQKKSKNGNEKRIFKIILIFIKKVGKMAETCHHFFSKTANKSDAFQI